MFEKTEQQLQQLQLSGKAIWKANKRFFSAIRNEIHFLMWSTGEAGLYLAMLQSRIAAPRWLDCGSTGTAPLPPIPVREEETERYMDDVTESLPPRAFGFTHPAAAVR